VEFGVQFTNILKSTTPRTQSLVELFGIRILNLWKMFAVAHWIGDHDCIGASGGNCGFVKTETNEGVLCKIDPGWFGRDVVSRILFTKDFHFSPHQNFIKFDNLCATDRNEFIREIGIIVNFSDFQIANMLHIEFSNAPVRVQNHFQGGLLQNELFVFLKSRRNQLRDIYRDYLEVI